DRTPFLCEWPEAHRVAGGPLRMSEYPAVPANSRHCLTAAGHEAAGQGVGTVVDLRDLLPVVGTAGGAVEGAGRLPGPRGGAAGGDPKLGFGNFGAYGERADQNQARLGDRVRRADVLVVQGGINDITQGVAVENAAERLRAMVRPGKERGLRVALADGLPWN